MDCDSEAFAHSGAMARLVECVPNFSEGRNKEVERSRSFPCLQSLPGPDGRVPPGFSFRTDIFHLSQKWEMEALKRSFH